MHITAPLLETKVVADQPGAVSIPSSLVMCCKQGSAISFRAVVLQMGHPGLDIGQ